MPQDERRVSLILPTELYNEVLNESQILDRSLNKTAVLLFEAAIKERKRQRDKNKTKNQTKPNL